MSFPQKFLLGHLGRASCFLGVARPPRSRTTAKLLETFEAVFHLGSLPPNNAVLLFQEVAVALVVVFTAFLTPRGYVLRNQDQFRRE